MLIAVYSKYVSKNVHLSVSILTLASIRVGRCVQIVSTIACTTVSGILACCAVFTTFYNKTHTVQNMNNIHTSREGYFPIAILPIHKIHVASNSAFTASPLNKYYFKIYIFAHTRGVSEVCGVSPPFLSCCR